MKVTLLQTVNTFNNAKEISIDNHIKDIINGTYSDSILNLRQYVKTTESYNNIKNKLTAIMPHGNFRGLHNEDLIQLSGLLFYDIDKFDGVNIDDVKDMLIKKYNPFYVARSSSNEGLHIFIKVNGLTIDNFSNTHKHIRNLLIADGFIIDKNASGLSRKVYVSYDTNAFYNPDSVFNIDPNLIPEVKPLVTLKKSSDATLEGYASCSNSSSIIPLKQLLTQIRTNNNIQVDVKDVYKIQENDTIFIKFDKRIKDDNKRRKYRGIIQKLLLLNPDITNQQIYSYLTHLNNSQEIKRMDDRLFNYHITTSINLFRSLLNNNTLNTKFRKKHIHFAGNVTTTFKQKVAFMLHNIKKVNNNIERIIEAKKELIKKGIKATQKNVATFLQLSISTIQRCWNKVVSNVKESIDNLFINNNKTTLDKIEVITFDEFFGPEDDHINVSINNVNNNEGFPPKKNVLYSTKETKKTIFSKIINLFKLNQNIQSKIDENQNNKDKLDDDRLKYDWS